MLKIGLTGNICAGKSEVEKIFSELGFLVIDLDKITHGFFENNEKVKSKILEEFQTLDRKEIGAIVFSNPDKMKVLESIIHPELKKYVLEIFKKADKKVIISGALLYEAGFNELFDKIIYVDAPYNLRLERLIKRNNLDEVSAHKRLDCQKDNKNRADFVIENTSTLDELKMKVKQLTNFF